MTIIKLTKPRSSMRKQPDLFTHPQVLYYRRHLLWILVLTLSLLAGWLIVGSMQAQWAIGILIGGFWFAAIAVNAFLIDGLLRKKVRKHPDEWT